MITGEGTDTFIRFIDAMENATHTLCRLHVLLNTTHGTADTLATRTTVIYIGEQEKNVYSRTIPLQVKQPCIEFHNYPYGLLVRRFVISDAILGVPTLLRKHLLDLATTLRRPNTLSSSERRRRCDANSYGLIWQTLCDV